MNRDRRVGLGDDLGPKDIARLDRKGYREPRRDLTATRPADPETEGAVGDVDNPTAATRSHGSTGPDGDEGTRGERHFDRKKI